MVFGYKNTILLIKTLKENIVSRYVTNALYWKPWYRHFWSLFQCAKSLEITISYSDVNRNLSVNLLLQGVNSTWLEEKATDKRPVQQEPRVVSCSWGTRGHEAVRSSVSLVTITLRTMARGLWFVVQISSWAGEVYKRVNKVFMQKEQNSQIQIVADD